MTTTAISGSASTFTIKENILTTVSLIECQRSAYEPKYIVFCANQIKKLNTIVGLGLFKTVYPINLKLQEI